MKSETKNNPKQQPMAAEPMPSYSAVPTQSSASTLSSEDKIMKETMSVDEYFDELISLVHQDYADF